MSKVVVYVPLHTRAKSRDHEICESPKESVQRLSQDHVPNHVVWSQALKCSVKSYVTGPSTKCYFNEFLFMQVLTHDKIEQTNSCEHSECHGLPVLC